MTARYPSEHERINAREWAGTRQLCARCDEPTGRCEEGAIYAGEYGPLCEVCADDLHCLSCDGEGVVDVRRNGRGNVDYLNGVPSGEIADCPTCGGTGHVSCCDGPARTANEPPTDPLAHTQPASGTRSPAHPAETSRRRE